MSEPIKVAVFKGQRYGQQLAGLLLVILLGSVQFISFSMPTDLPFVSRLNGLLYNARFDLLPPQRQHQVPIVIIDIDEASIQQQGRWPWPRQKVARLITQLRQDGAALIGLDIIFSEAQRNPVQRLLASDTVSSHLAAQLSPLVKQFSGDQQLAKQLEDSTVLSYFFQGDGTSAGQLPFPFYRLSGDEAARNRLLTMDDYTGSLPLLADHALGQGFVVAVPDSDGVVRRVPLVIRYQDGVYASLSLVMARLALGASWVKLGLVDNGSQYVATDINVGNKVDIPVGADGSMLVPFRGRQGAFPTLSATGVLNGQLSAKQEAQLNGAIVLVGTSALGLSDLRTIPLQTAFPGVEIHANVLDTILQAALGESVFYRQPDWTPGAALILLLFIGLLLALILPRRSPPVMIAWSAGSLLLVVGLNAWLWQGMHLAFPMALSLLLVVLLSAVNLTWGFVQSSRNKKTMQTLFGAYVPPAYVEVMLNQPEKANMEGEQRHMTVLFADICGFTTLSEGLTTVELKQLLNRYLTEVTRVIFAHQGTIDKYVGDMVMAFWNAPLDDAQHAHNGVQAALAMQREVTRLRELFVKEGLPPLAIGIGLNTGPMNVGDMGSNYRRAYTVLGDAVNLGSRLEGLTRFYGLDILVSDATQAACPAYLFRPIDRIRVKGKNEPVDVFEPIGLNAEVDATTRQQIERFAAALQAYHQRDFANALVAIEQLLLEDPSHATLYRCYIERCQCFIEQPPADDWQAVYTHTSK